jgi:RNA polymerase sigma factor (sigma-70 family)
MTANPVLHVLRIFRRKASVHESQEQSDGQLLERFVGGDGDALETLVRRHAPMVWGVCRRNLARPDDAEDAFQATFLVLLRKAGTIWPRERLANWLYGVAYKTACKARQTAAKRGTREIQETTVPEPPAKPPENGFGTELLALLDRELNGLPEKYRTAVVLCELQERTIRDVAQELRVKEGTVASRLARGREMLAQRMIRHGAVLTVGTVAAVCSQQAASGALPTALLTRTIEAVRLMEAGQHVMAGLLSAEASTLADAVLHTMVATKWKAASVVLLLAALAMGGVLVVYRNLPDQPREWEVAIDPEKYGSKVGAKTFARDRVDKNRGGNRVEEFGPATFEAQFDRLKNEWTVVVGMVIGMRIDGPPIWQKETTMVLKYNPSTRTYDVVSDDWMKAFAWPRDISEINGWRKVQLKNVETWARCDFIKPATTIGPVSSGWLVSQVPGEYRPPGSAEHAGPQIHDAGKLVARQFGGNALTANVTPRGVTILAQDANQKAWVCAFGAPEGHFLEVGAYGGEYGFASPMPSFTRFFPYCGIRYRVEGISNSSLWDSGPHDFVIWEIEIKEQRIVRLAIDFSDAGRYGSEVYRSGGSIRFNSHFELSKEVPKVGP